MQENEAQERNVHWIKCYEIGLSLYTVILAVVMIGIVLRIYLNGTSPSNLSEDGLYLQPVYSRELVAGYLQSLLPWFLLWVVAVIAGGFLHRRMPARKEFVPVSPEETFARLVRQIRRQSVGQPENRGAKENKSQSQGIWKWVDSFERRSGLNVLDFLHEYEFTESDEARSAVESLRQEQKKWYYVNLVCVFICGLCLGAAGSYLLNREHFISWDLEQVMGAMLRGVLPALVVAFVALCARSEWKKKSLERMIPQLRTIVAADAKTRLSQKKVIATESSKDSEFSCVRKSESVTEKSDKPEKPDNLDKTAKPEMLKDAKEVRSPGMDAIAKIEEEADPDPDLKSEPEPKLESEPKSGPEPKLGPEPKSRFKSKSPGSAKTFSGFSRLTISRLAIAVVAVIFLVIGVNNGGMRDVLVKAINICTECIGLG
ncbi:MAG: procyclic acidic repetitive family protein [Lachnospiraceae bacterium]|nr:procyclic acidic repetitive family protein [Lachnospiraceae bacterium]